MYSKLRHHFPQEVFPIPCQSRSGDFCKYTPLWQPVILCCNLLFAYVLTQLDQQLLGLEAETILSLSQFLTPCSNYNKGFMYNHNLSFLILSNKVNSIIHI